MLILIATKELCVYREGENVANPGLTELRVIEHAPQSVCGVPLKADAPVRTSGRQGISNDDEFFLDRHAIWEVEHKVPIASSQCLAQRGFPSQPLVEPGETEVCRCRQSEGLMGADMSMIGDENSFTDTFQS